MMVMIGLPSGVRAAGLLPPANPTQSIAPSAALQSACSSVPVTAACITVATAAIDADQVVEGASSISLPSNFAGLTVPEQTFVVVNLERIDRGLTPIAGLASSLDSLAQQGADADSDPPLTAPGNPEVGNWGSTPNPLYADALFMYDDGPGGPNVDCTVPGDPGCWEHRDNLLLTDSQQLLMGVGETTSDADHGSLCELIVAGDTADTPYFTWAAEIATLSLQLSATQLTVPAAVGATGTATLAATASGSAMTVSMALAGSPEVTLGPTSCGSLAAGASCPISLTFTPTSVGAAAATLTVTGLDGAHAVSVLGVTNPGSPLGLTASAGPAGIAVTWGSVNDGGSPVTAYRVLRAGALGQPGTLVATVAGAATSWTDTTASPGASYLYSVEAVNVVGVSDPTPQALATAPGAAQQGSPNPLGPLLAGTGLTGTGAKPGYWMLGATGAVYGFGSSANLGGPQIPAGMRAMDIVSSPSGNGYWVVDSRGDVSAYGDATNLGGGPTLDPGEIVTSLSATPDGKGYWIFTSRGRVFTYGDAPFLGDMSAVTLNGPVVGSVATPTGKGYYMVATDGGIFTFGDAVFEGSMGGQHINQPVLGLAPNPTGPGYWLVALDGGVFAFGAPFLGSMGSVLLNRPVIGLVSYGDGYLMVAGDGGIFDFSHLGFVGSLGADPPAIPIVAVSAT